MANSKDKNDFGIFIDDQPNTNPGFWGQLAAAGRKILASTQIILTLNVIVISAILVYMLVTSPPQSTNANTPNQAPAVEPAKPIQITPPQNMPQPTKTVQIELNDQTQQALDQAISWKLAEQLYQARNYDKAYYVFSKLSENLAPNTEYNQSVKDFLSLKMVLCLEKSQTQDDLSELFTIALQSRSPLVRAMANYNLAFIEYSKKRYRESRMRAYKALALIKAFEGDIHPDIEEDCQFLIAESITKEISQLENYTEDLPGNLWSDNTIIQPVPYMEQDKLIALLIQSTEILNEAVLVPQITKHEHLSVGLRYSTFSLDAPLEEVLARFASTADLNLNWQETGSVTRKTPVMMYLTASSEQFIAEVSAGMAGIIARIEEGTIKIYDPAGCETLEEETQMLTNEALSLWRKYLLKYPGKPRTANAHFALGLLHNYSGQTMAALGEYKLLSSHYDNNTLAPFALLEASKIKTNLRDYTGARNDLNEIIIQYPDCKVVDKASLYLAQATMEAEIYDEAIKLFHRVNNLDLNEQSKVDSAFGLGKCYHKTGKYQEAIEWLTKAAQLIQNPNDDRLTAAFSMLGKTYMELKEYPRAAAALRNALAGTKSKEEHIKIMLELVKAESARQEYITALDILENVPTEQLSQHDSCNITIAKAEIYRQIGVCETAVSLLRRKIEFIADSELRAMLLLELAKCYHNMKDYRIARTELTEAITNLPAGKESIEANLILADVNLQLGDFSQAEKICLGVLKNLSEDTNEYNHALNLLGQVYTALKEHEKAALAYAGVVNTSGGAL